MKIFVLRRYGFLVSVLAIVALVFASLTVSSAGTAPDIREYGPFHSESPDSGTCGNDWATDTFNRYFSFDTTAVGGTYTVTQEFRQGKFETIAGSSPGACDPDETPNTVAAGIKGKFTGTFTIIVTGGVYNAAAKPGPGTSTASFVAEVFGPNATYSIPEFSFVFTTTNNGSWINSSNGNSGDITGTP